MSHPFDDLQDPGLDKSILSSEQIRRREYGHDHAGGEYAGQGLADENRQDVAVIREDTSVGQAHLKTVVLWDPKDGSHPMAMEWDIHPVDRSHFQMLPNGERTLEPSGFGLIIAICPLCGPDAPQYGPDRFRGQINMNCLPDADNRMLIHPWFDEVNRLHVMEPVRCGWLPCTWSAEVRAGLAVPAKGKASRRYTTWLAGLKKK